MRKGTIVAPYTIRLFELKQYPESGMGNLGCDLSEHNRAYHIAISSNIQSTFTERK